GHHRVAYELLDAAAVALDDLLHPLEVASQDRAQGLGIGGLSELRRPRDVAEENRHGLPLLARRRGGSHGRAALGAELRALGNLVATRRARAHATRLLLHSLRHHLRDFGRRGADLDPARLERLLLSLRRAGGAGD